MNNNSKNLALILAIIALGIGFAALTATLTINGNVYINGNASDFKVLFSDVTTEAPSATASVNGLSYTLSAPTLSATYDTITFAPEKAVITKGDHFDLKYTIVNSSKLYDAKIEIACKSTAEGSTGLSIFTLGGDTSIEKLEAQGKKTGTLTFTLADDIESTEDGSKEVTEAFTCSVVASALSRTSVAS